MPSKIGLLYSKRQFRMQTARLGRSRFWRSDVTWLEASGEVDPASSQMALHLTGAGEEEGDLYVSINGQSPDVVDTDQDTAGDEGDADAVAPDQGAPAGDG